MSTIQQFFMFFGAVAYPVFVLWVGAKLGAKLGAKPRAKRYKIGTSYIY